MFLKKRQLDRRTMLRGMLGGAAVSIALPPLEIFFNGSGTAYAVGGGFPIRFGLFFWGNGVLPQKWTPTGEVGVNAGDAWQLSEQLQPLADVKQHISVISGMSVKTGVQNNIPHESGAAGILSGSMWNGTDMGGTPMGPTVDQIIAAELGALTRFKSIEFGAEPGEGYSWNGLNSRNPPESSPAALFERVFGGGFSLPSENAGPDPRLKLRRSVLDAVIEDAKALQQRLGQTDRERLDQHLSSLRELEQRIRFIEENPPNLEACNYPTEPLADYPNIEGRPQMAAKHRAMTDIMVMALACDQTRVFSNFFSRPVNNILFLEPGQTNANLGHHQLTHDEPGDQPTVNEIVKVIMGEFAYMVERLSQIPEGEATLLDNSAVLATTDCSLGRTHSLDNYPLVIAGKAGGKLKSNIHYRDAGGDNASKVILSLVRAVGVTAGSFGVDDGETTDGLGAIEV